MQTKIIPLSLLLASLLTVTASAVTFKNMPAAKARIMPNDTNQILSFSAAIEKAKDSIVYIATTQSKTQEYLQKINPLFEEYFGRRLYPHPIPKRQSLGSGVIATEDGYIITNSHVVKNADEIMVKLAGSEKEYRAKLIGSDPKSDIAVIKIEAHDLTPIEMGDSSHLKIGDVVFAIGNPFGVGLSVTQGIISAQHKNGIGINEYENFIQTDASINPGNSGGALVDSRGALIGINSAIISRSGGNNGIGFAIEVDMVKTIAKKLIEQGSIDRGYLGVSIANLTKELRKLYDSEKGALLIDILPDSPAEKAGLQRGDLIVDVDGKAIDDASDLKNAIGMCQPGKDVALTFERDHRRQTVNAKLQSLETVSAAPDALFKGLALEDLNEQYRYRLHIPQDIEGILVVTVDQDSEAADQGLRPGDVIVQVEKTPVDSLDALAKTLKGKRNNYKRVYVYRDGNVFVIALK